MGRGSRWSGRSGPVTRRKQLIRREQRHARLGSQLEPLALGQIEIALECRVSGRRVTAASRKGGQTDGSNHEFASKRHGVLECETRKLGALH